MAAKKKVVKKPAIMVEIEIGEGKKKGKKKGC